MKINRRIFVMEIFNFIDNICPEIAKNTSILSKQVSDLKEYEKPEYLHLLLELKFSNENLYAHDLDQPDYNTLQKDFYKLIVDGLKFVNYCDLIGYEYIKYNKLDNCISDIKTKYYEYFPEELSVIDLLESAAEELEESCNGETELTRNIKLFLSKY
jgi:hypothetical protein